MRLTRRWLLALSIASSSFACVVFFPEYDENLESADSASAAEFGVEGAAGEVEIDAGPPEPPPDTGWDEPDFAASCGTPCDLWGDADCPEGEKCTMVRCGDYGEWNSHLCREIQGDAQLGDACSRTDEESYSGNDTCAEGLICMSVDGDSGLGLCVPLCEGSMDEPSCPEGYTCQISSNEFYALCAQECDPLGQDCASAQEMCLPGFNVDDFLCHFNASGGARPYGAVCGWENACNPGLLCAWPPAVPEFQCNDERCCSPMCSTLDADPCPGPGQECLPIFDPPAPGHEDIGLCLLPG